MAYIIGVVSREERARLVALGWDLEPPPAELIPEDMEVGEEVVQIYVDADIFDIVTDNGPWDRRWDMTNTVPCKFCGLQVPVMTAHRHDGAWVGDECCWTEQLRGTE